MKRYNISVSGEGEGIIVREYNTERFYKHKNGSLFLYFKEYYIDKSRVLGEGLDPRSARPMEYPVTIEDAVKQFNSGTNVIYGQDLNVEEVKQKMALCILGE